MSETWFAPIRAYCERTDAAFWAEPLNALSNGAFLVAAVLAVVRVRRGPVPDRPALALSGLVAVVGLGSFLFHTFAVRWSELADVLPIALFIFGYFLLALRRFFELGPFGAGFGTLLFAAFSVGLEPGLDAAAGVSSAALTNGSVGYLPAILALIGVAAGLLFSRSHARAVAGQRAGRGLLAIAALFAVSLGLRTLDSALCPHLPSGTHFLWHVLNAAVLYGLIRVAHAYRVGTA